jgi:hypothetical protein
MFPILTGCREIVAGLQRETKRAEVNFHDKVRSLGAELNRVLEMAESLTRVNINGECP